MSDIQYLPETAKIEKGPLLWWQKEGLSYTASGYGKKIPSEYIAHWNGRKYRVYFMVYGNSGAPYIVSKGQRYFINNWQFPTN